MLTQRGSQGPLTSDCHNTLWLYCVATLINEDVGEISWKKVGRYQPGERWSEVA